jgi:hypothetical protein
VHRASLKAAGEASNITVRIPDGNEYLGVGVFADDMDAGANVDIALAFEGEIITESNNPAGVDDFLEAPEGLMPGEYQVMVKVSTPPLYCLSDVLPRTCTASHGSKFWNTALHCNNRCPATATVTAAEGGCCATSLPRLVIALPPSGASATVLPPSSICTASLQGSNVPSALTALVYIWVQNQAKGRAEIAAALPVRVKPNPVPLSAAAGCCTAELSVAGLEFANTPNSRWVARHYVTCGHIMWHVVKSSHLALQMAKAVYIAWSPASSGSHNVGCCTAVHCRIISLLNPRQAYFSPPSLC